MSEFEWLAAEAYARGVDAIDYGVSIVARLIDAHHTINAARTDNPQAFGFYGPDASPEQMARRVLAALLDAGWTPPAVSA